MAGTGGYNPCPYSCGGEDSTIELLHGALLKKYAPGWDVTDNSIKNAEAYAEALCLGLVWDCNTRLSKQWQPTKMMEWLMDWEEAMDLHPNVTANPVERRRAVLGKLAGSAGNTLGDIIALCTAVAGDKFIGIGLSYEGQEVSYYPGVNPGPPGYEFCSSRLVIGVELSIDSVPTKAQQSFIDTLYSSLDGMVPAWMRIQIGTGGSFTTGTSLVGDTIV